jgi:hypothetical protein
VPSGFAGLEQMPLAGSQVPASWHWSEAEQVTGVPPHWPLPLQVSPVVQAAPSSHVLVFGDGGFEHWPVVGLHVPAS